MLILFWLSIIKGTNYLLSFKKNFILLVFFFFKTSTLYACCSCMTLVNVDLSRLPLLALSWISTWLQRRNVFLLFRFNLKRIGKLDRYDISSKVYSGYISRTRCLFAQIANFWISGKEKSWEFYTHTQTSAQGRLCILLRRLAYPNRMADLVSIFGRNESEISLILISVILRLYYPCARNDY